MRTTPAGRFACGNCGLEFEDAYCDGCGANLMPPKRLHLSSLTDLRKSTATASTSAKGALAVADRRNLR